MVDPRGPPFFTWELLGNRVPKLFDIDKLCKSVIILIYLKKGGFMSSFAQISGFLICYVILILFLVFMSKKAASKIGTFVEAPALKIFGVLSLIMSLCFFLVFFLVGININEVSGDIFFFVIAVFFVLQLFIALYIILGHLRELFFLFEDGLRQLLGVMVFALIPSYFFASVVVDIL